MPRATKAAPLPPNYNDPNDNTCRSGVRALAFIRDGHNCALCGYHGATYGRDLQGDHIIPIADGGDELDLDNVRTLCVDCHKGSYETMAPTTEAQGRKRG